MQQAIVVVVVVRGGHYFLFFFGSLGFSLQILEADAAPGTVSRRLDGTESNRSFTPGPSGSGRRSRCNGTKDSPALGFGADLGYYIVV